MNTGLLESERLRQLLSSAGFAVARPVTLDGFYDACHRLGTIHQTTQVRITPEKRQYPFQSDAVPFHTDHPTIPVVAWYCERQDADDGANLLVDTRRIVDTLPHAHRRTLSEVRLRIFHRTEFHPLLSLDPYHIYWLPVVIHEALACTKSIAEAIDAFQAVLDRCRETGNVPPIRLRPGEALFVNNRIMLHGRRVIRQDSKRSLIRVYVT